ERPAGGAGQDGAAKIARERADDTAEDAPDGGAGPHRPETVLRGRPLGRRTRSERPDHRQRERRHASASVEAGAHAMHLASTSGTEFSNGTVLCDMCQELSETGTSRVAVSPPVRFTGASSMSICADADDEIAARPVRERRHVVEELLLVCVAATDGIAFVV